MTEEKKLVLAKGGVIKKILVPGVGDETPPPGAEVTVHFVGKVAATGVTFDSTRETNSPFTFRVGVKQMLKGWDIVIPTMKKGEKSIVTMKPEFAYGEHEPPNAKIPRNAALVFEIEIIGWTTAERITADGKVTSEMVRAGAGYSTPQDFGLVRISFKGWIKGRQDPFVVVDTPTSYALDDLVLPWGLVEALKTMRMGQISKVSMTSEYGYGSQGDEKLGIPPNADLVYEVTLDNMLKGREIHDMAPTEKANYGQMMKEFGNKVYKAGQFQRARKIYDDVLKLLQYETELEPDEEKQITQLRLECLSNKAAVWYQEKNYAETVHACNAVLKLDPKHYKTLFRKVQSCAHTNDHEEALTTISIMRPMIAEREAKGESVAEKAVLDKLEPVLKTRLRAAEKKKTQTFGGFFDKVKLVGDNEGIDNDDDRPRIVSVTANPEVFPPELFGGEGDQEEEVDKQE